MMIIKAVKEHDIYTKTRFYVVGVGFVKIDDVLEQSIIVKRMTSTCKRRIKVMESLGYEIVKRNI